MRRGPVGGMGGQMEEGDEDEDDGLINGAHGTVDQKDDKRHALQKRNQKGDRKGSKERKVSIGQSQHLG